jgi:hypothetical protein
MPMFQGNFFSERLRDPTPWGSRSGVNVDDVCMSWKTKIGLVWGSGKYNRDVQQNFR